MEEFSRFISRLSHPQLVGLRESIQEFNVGSRSIPKEQDPLYPLKLKYIDREINRATIAPKSNKLAGGKTPKYWNAKRAPVPKGNVPVAPILWAPDIINKLAIPALGAYAEPGVGAIARGFGVKDTRTAREIAISKLEWKNASNYLQYVFSDDYLTKDYIPQTVFDDEQSAKYSELRAARPDLFTVNPDTYAYKKSILGWDVPLHYDRY